MPTTARLITGATLGLLALFINPGFACSGEEEPAPRWEYDQADMRAAVEGTYTLELQGSGELVTIRIEQAGASSARRLQCGNVTRSFVRDAGACGTQYRSEIAVLARIQSDASEIPSGDYRGSFAVEGTELEVGELYISVHGESDLQAEYRDEEMTSWRLQQDSGEALRLNRVRGASTMP
jgi:hypothetical protein